ncbi:hypothetical protein BS78_02G166000 [Paspalum vaginatum]|nr:hypothetical protein BS78_02G166000 [Paspalum vaginatum]
MASVPAASTTAPTAASDDRVVCFLRRRGRPTTRRPWTGDEDAQLERLVATEHGFRDCDWGRVASHLPGRSPRQCRDRWCHYLARHIYHRPFTVSDDDELAHLYVRHVGRWRDMSRDVYGRTSSVLRHRWREIRYTNAFLSRLWRPRPPPDDAVVAEKSKEDQEQGRKEESHAQQDGVATPRTRALVLKEATRIARDVDDDAETVVREALKATALT